MRKVLPAFPWGGSSRTGTVPLGIAIGNVPATFVLSAVVLLLFAVGPHGRNAA